MPSHAARAVETLLGPEKGTALRWTGEREPVSTAVIGHFPPRKIETERSHATPFPYATRQLLSTGRQSFGIAVTRRAKRETWSKSQRRSAAEPGNERLRAVTPRGQPPTQALNAKKKSHAGRKEKRLGVKSSSQRKEAKEKARGKGPPTVTLPCGPAVGCDPQCAQPSAEPRLREPTSDRPKTWTEKHWRTLRRSAVRRGEDATRGLCTARSTRRKQNCRRLRCLWLQTAEETLTLL